MITSLTMALSLLSLARFMVLTLLPNQVTKRNFIRLLISSPLFRWKQTRCNCHRRKCDIWTSYLNADEAECSLVIGELITELAEINTDCFAGNGIALKLEHGPALDKDLINYTFGKAISISILKWLDST